MIHPNHNKYPQHNQKSESFLNCNQVIIPLTQHIGKEAILEVQPKQKVTKGQLIGSKDGFISSDIHSPITGIVKDIGEYPHPVLGRAKAVVIAREEAEDNEKLLPNDWDTQKIISNAGIVGMGGAGFPSHVKLNPPKKIDTLIINACECEPYLACDYRLMVENTAQIWEGIKIIADLLKIENLFVAVEDNKPEAVKRWNYIFSVKKNLPCKGFLKVLPSAYPQGAEKQLIYVLTKRKVPRNGLPLDVGCVVQNIATCYAIYQAVHLKKPLIQRLVTFAGAALNQPKNIWVNIGTSIRELFEQKILEFKETPFKIIHGGPMMGIALDSLDYPILKTTSGILFLTEKEAPINKESVCIRCSRCVDVCPMNLLPLELARYLKYNKLEETKELFLTDCIECGCCSYICPAKIPIVHYIKIGKMLLRKKGLK